MALPTQTQPIPLLDPATVNEALREAPPERRRSRRRPTPGVLVAIEAPQVDRDLCWAATAFDINGDGIGVSLPEEVEVGSDVLLTFRIEGEELRRVPGTVLRKDHGYGLGAIEFGPWPEADRLTLLNYLLAG